MHFRTYTTDSIDMASQQQRRYDKQVNCIILLHSTVLITCLSR